MTDTPEIAALRAEFEAWWDVTSLPQRGLDLAFAAYQAGHRRATEWNQAEAALATERQRAERAERAEAREMEAKCSRCGSALFETTLSKERDTLAATLASRDAEVGRLRDICGRALAAICDWRLGSVHQDFDDWRFMRASRNYLESIKDALSKAEHAARALAPPAPQEEQQ